MYFKGNKWIEINYYHPGKFREFIYKIGVDIPKKEEKFMAWSCCNNTDKNAKGCQRKKINKHKYYPIRTERKVTRYYTNENYDDSDDDEDFEFDDEKDYRNNKKYKKYKEYPSKYEKEEMTYYDY